jgi:hypothetical protein
MVVGGEAPHDRVGILAGDDSGRQTNGGTGAFWSGLDYHVHFGNLWKLAGHGRRVAGSTDHQGARGRYQSLQSVRCLLQQRSLSEERKQKLGPGRAAQRPETGA